MSSCLQTKTMGCNNNVLSKRPGSRKYGSIQSETVTPAQAEAYQAASVRSYLISYMPNILYCGIHLDTHSNLTRRAAHKKTVPLGGNHPNQRERSSGIIIRSARLIPMPPRSWPIRALSVAAKPRNLCIFSSNGRQLIYQ